jgi:hypothetical protein
MEQQKRMARQKKRPSKLSKPRRKAGNATAIASKPAPRPKLTNAKLKELAAKHKPPQAWYDETEQVC